MSQDLWTRREALALAGTALVGAGATACRRHRPLDRPGTLILATGVALPSVQNPLLDLADRAIFNKLFRFDARFHPIPELADRFDLAPDGRSYDVRLRPNARWH